VNPMPIYEYVCASCANRFDRLRPMSEMDAEAPCPACDGESSRALSVFAAFSSGDNGDTRSVAGGCGGCGPGGCACAMGA